MSAVELLTEVAGLGLSLKVDGERLRFHPRDKMPMELAARLKASKGEILAELRRLEEPAPIPFLPVAEPGDDEEAGEDAQDGPVYIDLPDPCPSCGGLLFWWNCLGERFCLNCRPPHPRAAQLRELAASLRKPAASS